MVKQATRNDINVPNKFPIEKKVNMLPDFI